MGYSPQVRGAFGEVGIRALGLGSSPRTRGARISRRVLHLGAGLIPAGAGSTRRPGRLFYVAGLIPAGAGSTGVVVAPVTPSPAHPRGRGAPRLAAAHRSPHGLIPAGAGNTERDGHLPPLARAHPRARGEDAEKFDPQARAWGSSPRARGARLRHTRIRQIRGLIPAGAGSTRRFRARARMRRAHPRGRGEHMCRFDDRRFSGGSSPRARGAPLVGGVRGVAHGLIPAGAGSTLDLMSDVCDTRAHPRGRGEHSTVRPHHCSLSGLIPAGAGSTYAAETPESSPRAHPRGRGEHTS